MKYLVTLIVLIATVSAFGQTRTFKWGDELCEYVGTYNAKKYTDTKLRNTLRLLSHDELRLDTVEATVWKFEEIEKLNVATLDARYKKLINDLEKLDYIPTPYTNSVQQAKLEEAKQLYQLARTTMLAYKTPEAIRKYNGAEACKLNFGEPIIAGGDALLAAWRKVNLNSQSKNSDPARLQGIFDEQNGSPDRLKFALVETMSFGWWNCANNEIKYADINDSGRPDKEFRKLFLRVRTIRCDEP